MGVPENVGGRGAGGGGGGGGDQKVSPVSLVNS